MEDKRKVIEAARTAGKEARLIGQPREIPAALLKDYPVRGRGKAWLEGWDLASKDLEAAVAAAFKVQEPVVRIQEPEIRLVGVSKNLGSAQFWPDGEPLPETYPKRLAVPPQPCAFKDCRALVLDGGAQAVITEVTAHGFAYLRCRRCKRGFKRRIA